MKDTNNWTVLGKVVMININAVKPSPFNPPSRLDERHLIALQNSIDTDGFRWWEPVLLTESLQIGDGHRRYCASRNLGLKSIPAMIVPGKTASQIWSEVNGTRKEMTSFAVAEAVVLGLDTIPARFAKPIGDIRDTGGEDMLRYLVEKKTSPNIYKEAKRIAVYCGLSKANDFIAKLIYWLVDFNMQKIARLALESPDNLTNIIVAAVADRRPLTMIISVQ